MLDIPAPLFAFDNSYARDLAGGYVRVAPAPVAAPRLVMFNTSLAAELGLDAARLAGEDGAAIFAGNILPAGAEPIAMAYAGHQFGGFSPQLGDGRAVLLGEVIDVHGRRRDLQLKGSGQTPFSRRGDGRAALGPMLRELIIGEALAGLGIATTRALAVAATGEPVYRERGLPGAVVTRVAASHLRVGTFQFFAARRDTDMVKRLADYAIARHYPELAGSAQPYRAFLEQVVERQARLIAQWMLVGFVHGVMNTDNMSISGESIDFGPCAFMDGYHPGTVFSSIDEGGRYAYANQPPIAQWNLARLAETLLALIDGDGDKAAAIATEIVNSFAPRFAGHWQAGMAAKLGLAPAEEGDAGLIEAWLDLLRDEGADFTLAHRHLAAAALGEDAALRSLWRNAQPTEDWLARWRQRLARDGRSAEARAAAMNAVNPLFIARNHLVEAALAAAETDDLMPTRDLLAVLAEPFVEHPQRAALAALPPASDTPYRTFCGT